MIPARYASTRFPGKVLADLCGRPLLWHVWERVRRARSVDRVLVATDDERVLSAARAFGAEARMTSAACRSGTDRVEEAVRDVEADVVVNVQGDEPLLEPEQVDAAVAALVGEPAADIGAGTLAFPLADDGEVADPNLVKVVTAADDRALYFSRAPIPWDRAAGGGLAATSRGHVGIYAYRRDVLERFVRLPEGRLERIEALEQLRLLENGIAIRVAATQHRSIGVDVPGDLDRARQALAAAAGGRAAG